MRRDSVVAADHDSDVVRIIHRGFKSLKQAIKLEFKLKRHEKVVGQSIHDRALLNNVLGRGTLQ